MDTMQDFFNSLVESPELVASTALNSFLSMNEKEFSRFKTGYEKLSYSNPNAVLSAGVINKKMFYQKNPVKVEHLVRHEGAVECRIDSKLKDLFTHADTAIKDWLPIYSKCKQSSLQLATTLATAKSQADQLALDVEGLQKTASKFNEAVGRKTEHPWDTLEVVYSTLCDTLRGLGLSLAKQSDSIHECVHNTFLYSEKEILTLQELVKNREEASILFYKTYFELEEKKDKQIQVADFGGKSILDVDRANIPREELLRNRVIAKYLMFPEVSSCHQGK